MEWDAMQWDAMEWNAVQWNTMECNAMECNAMEGREFTLAGGDLPFSYNPTTSPLEGWPWMKSPL